MPMPTQGLRLTPSQILVIGFATLILVGSIVLMLPVSSASGQWTPFVDALFTATSAVCVTGLIVVDTATHWSLFGQAVILILIQVGGLGIMTMSTLVAFLLGKRISLKERLIMQEAFGGTVSLAGLVRLTKHVLVVTFLIEAVGALILFLRWSLDYPLPKALWLGVFHAVSAFCNAGFDLFSVSLVNYVDDWTVILTVSGLIVLGGLGFTVILDLWNHRRGGRFSLHTKLVLVVSGLLIVIGTGVIFVLEYSNPKTLEPLSPAGKFLGALFHSISPRTAGYNSLVTGDLYPGTLFVTIILMFIGASPASTGGGIKTTTFGALVMAVWSTIRGKPEVEVFERRLVRDVVDRGLAITSMAWALVTIFTIVLLVSEGARLIDALFEVTSAFGTVGLSTGLTPKLTDSGKLLITLTMYIGRVGPLTLAVALAQRSQHPNLHYPEDRVLVG